MSPPVDALASLDASDGDLGRELPAVVGEHGAVIVRGVDVADDEALLAVIGLVAEPSAVGNGGELIFEVTPRPDGGDRSGRRAAFELHTDSTFLPEPHDVIALGCLVAAEGSGQSLVAHVDSVRERIAVREGEAVLAELELPTFPFVLEPPGAPEATAVLLPILRARKEGYGVRYREDVMQRLRAAGVPMTDTAAGALASFARVVAEEGLPQSFTLGPGDLLVVDNHRVLHGRRSVDEASSRLLRRVKAFRRSATNGQESHLDKEV